MYSIFFATFSKIWKQTWYTNYENNSPQLEELENCLFELSHPTGPAGIPGASSSSFGAIIKTLRESSENRTVL